MTQYYSIYPLSYKGSVSAPELKGAKSKVFAPTLTSAEDSEDVVVAPVAPVVVEAPKLKMATFGSSSKKTAVKKVGGATKLDMSGAAKKTPVLETTDLMGGLGINESTSLPLETPKVEEAVVEEDVVEEPSGGHVSMWANFQNS